MKKVLLGVFAIVVAVAAYMLYSLGLFTQEENVREAKNAPAVKPFKKAALDFTHRAKGANFPFIGAAIIDIDGDGIMEAFVSGTQDQANSLFRYQNGTLVDVAPQADLNGIEASYGATSIDIDNDGDVDLLVAQASGVWLYTNSDGVFSGKNLNVQLPSDTVPLAITTADLNHDGFPELYISNFVAPSKFVASTFNSVEHAKKNILLLNNGDSTFTDITEKAGVAASQNTFHSAFVDLDNDGRLDLVVANNTGHVEIFRQGDAMKFEKNSFTSGLGYWMGLGIGDIDKDGDQDLYLSNIGATIPADLTRGDMTDDQQVELEWLLLRNDGNMNFTNATADYSLTEYGFGWGGVFEDINLDGELDLLVAQNYVKWPKHKASKLPGKAFVQLSQNGKKGFYHLDSLGLNNSEYGQTTLIADLNNDGKPDVIWVNMIGASHALINESDNNFLKVVIPDSAEYLGARAVLELANGQSYTRQVAPSTGFASDQSPNLFFGLGSVDAISSLKVTLSDGSVKTIQAPDINSTVSLN
ncbi:MAG: VCBS repeat-containing protein [Amphritea sp.]